MHPMTIHTLRSAITISDDGSLGQKTTFSSLFTSHMLIMNNKGRCDVLGILVDDAEVMQVLHLEQDGTRDGTKRSLALLSANDKPWNEPKYSYGMSFRQNGRIG